MSSVVRTTTYEEGFSWPTATALLLPEEAQVPEGGVYAVTKYEEAQVPEDGVYAVTK